MRPCRICGEDLPLTEFYKDRSAKDGLQKICKSCSSARCRSWRESGGAARMAAYSLAHHFQKNYGMTIADVDAAIAAQNNECKICQAPVTRGRGKFAVDHCHSTGAVRSILCMPCNTGLGNFRDQTDLLRAAIEYLEDHRGRN